MEVGQQHHQQHVQHQEADIKHVKHVVINTQKQLNQQDITIVLHIQKTHQDIGKNVQIVEQKEIAEHIVMEAGQQQKRQHVQKREADIKHVKHVVINIQKQ